MAGDPDSSPQPEGGAVSVRETRRFSLGDLAFLTTSQVLLLIWAVFVIFPFIWMITT